MSEQKIKVNFENNYNEAFNDFKNHSSTMANANANSNQSVETVDLNFLTNNNKQDIVADSFFEKFGNGNYGIDQGITKKIYNEYKYVSEAPRILEKLQTYYGFSYMDSYSLMTNMDSAGACTYAAFANEIINYFSNDEENFKNIFGFDMYITLNDGTKILNSAELLIDMFIYCNIGNIFGIDQNNHLYINSKNNNNHIDVSKQKILDTQSIKEKYLNTKGLKYTQKSYITKNLNFTENDNEEINEVKNTLINEFNNGQSIILTVNSGGNGINLHGENETIVNTNSFGIGGHAVFVTNVDNSKITVSSWGKKYFINYNELTDTRFEIVISNIS